ncbi:MAG: LLM class flavin-dependent oxidoreductase [Proteobacteria bacterium]|nr:LLM class flavin-dependent oxidoreductase [Pseudomonadota bacterium]
MGIKLGLQLWNQAFDWPEARRAALRAEELGYDHLWSWEHLLACVGDPYLETHDAYTLLTAWSQITSTVRLGVLTGCNTFRSPGLLAKTVTTLDHVSEGRAILGLGAGWFEPEHTAYGVEFGSGFGDRLAWLDESAAALRGLLNGETVNSPEGGHYSLTDARLMPLPVQERLPIMIGGGGEKKTLRTVARYADMWNWAGTADLDLLRHKDQVLQRHCEEAGRDHTEIERTLYVAAVIRDTEEEALSFFQSQIKTNQLDSTIINEGDLHITTQEQVTELMISWKELGFGTFILQVASPFDDESAKRFATDIRPIVESA